MLNFFLAALLPLLLFGFILRCLRKHHDNKAREPFTDLPLRPPGESLRLKIKDINSAIDDHAYGLVALTIIGAIPFLNVKNLFVTVILWGAFLVPSLLILWNIKNLLQKLWNSELGYIGERLVGEELNQLMANGFNVFHDVVFDKFNIDHVAVGASGVFSVETKAWKKPPKSSSPSSHRVSYDGLKLTFPNGVDTKALEQSERNARALSNWLSQATGESVSVQAILTFPGWYIERTTLNTIAVLNPKEIRQFVLTKSFKPIRAEQLKRIVYQLTERCRMSKN